MPYMTVYTEKDVCFLLSEVNGIGKELESALVNARRAAAEGDLAKTAACMHRVNALLAKIGRLTGDGAIRAGRPRAEINKSGDRTLGGIRNALRLCVPAGTLAGELGISESTFRRRMRKAEYLPDDVLFSQIP